MISGSRAYVRPSTLADAVAVLAEERRTIVSGGTDVFPSSVGRPLKGPVLDVSRVSELRRIAEDGTHIRLGGAVTWSEIAAHPLPPALNALRAAAREVGSLQIQNRGTIAGNLCNASPAADGVPALLILDAEVELASPRGTRRLPLAAFITGYRQTARQADEILAAVLVPNANGRSAFCKLGVRRYLVISILMAAALIETAADGSIARAAVAIGAASPVAQRLTALENDLLGLPPGVLPSSRLRPDHLQVLSPIDDVRATAGYRREAALAIAGRALDLALAGTAP